MLVNIDSKFKKSNEIADEFVNIIAPTFGLTKSMQFIVKSRLKLVSKEELRQCLINVFKFLLAEYKK